MAADVAVQFSNQVLDTTSPVTVAIEGKFDLTEVSGTVVQMATNAPVAEPNVYVALYDDVDQAPTDGRTTPLTVQNFLSYVNSSAYDNSMFHRSVSGFVLQGGGFNAPTVAADQPGSDPTSIVSGPAVQNEPGNSNVFGTIAMARLGADPDTGQSNVNSATNQFFFNMDDNEFLDSQNEGFTVFGEVLGSGMSAISAMNAALTYDATEYYFNTAMGELPLYNINTDNIIQPQDFLKLNTVDVVSESDLMTYEVTTSNSSKLTASFDSNGDLVLTPLGTSDNPVVVTVTATSILDDSTASDAFSVQLGGPVAPVLTAIEEVGNTVLNQDQNGNLYAGETAIEYNGNHLNFQTWVNKGWTAVAADTVNGNNRLVWKIGEALYQFEYAGSSWATVTSGVAGGAPDSARYYATEQEQGIDLDGDGTVGAPFTLTPIESAGGIILNQDQNGDLYAGETAIEYNGNHLNFQTWVNKGYTAVAADTVNGNNRLVWKIGEALYQFEYAGSSWATVTSGVAGGAPDSARYYATEQEQGVDFDGDTIVGRPIIISAIESLGDTVLNQDQYGNLYAGSVPIAYNGNHLNFQTWVNKGWTAVAADTVNGNNRLVWKIGEALYQFEYAGSSWATVTSGVAGGAPDSARYYATEQEQGIDLDGDGTVGAPFTLTPIESAGGIILNQDQNGDLYAGETAIEYNGNHLNFQTWVNKGYTAVAADTVNGNNRLVWKIGDVLYQFEYSGSSWSTVTKGVAGGAPDSDLYYATEQEQGVDLDGDTKVGSPIIESVGSTTLKLGQNGNLYAGDTAIEYNGNQLNFQTWVNKGYTAVAADTVNGNNRLVWKLGDVLYQFEYSGSSWTTVTRGVAGGTPDSDLYYATELEQGIDFDGNTVVGAPTVVIEDFGNVSLINSGGILFADDNQLEFNGTPLNYDLWVNRGWTAMAADDNVEGKNVLVWKIGDALYKFEYDSTWTTVVKGYGSQAPGTAGFYEAEVGYGVNFDGLNGIGN